MLEGKADEARALVAKAEKTLNQGRFAGMFSGNKYENAAELLEKAANGFKLAKKCTLEPREPQKERGKGGGGSRAGDLYPARQPAFSSQWLACARPLSRGCPPTPCPPYPPPLTWTRGARAKDPWEGSADRALGGSQGTRRERLIGSCLTVTSSWRARTRRPQPCRTAPTPTRRSTWVRPSSSSGTVQSSTATWDA